MFMNGPMDPWAPQPAFASPVVYDGFGNPVGLPFIAALAPIAKAVLPSLIPAAGNLVSNILKRRSAWTACGLLAGKMRISPAFT